MSDAFARAINDSMKQEVKRIKTAERAKLGKKLEAGGSIESDDIPLLEPHEWTMWTLAQMLSPIYNQLESIDNSLRIMAGRPPAPTAEEAGES